MPASYGPATLVRPPTRNDDAVSTRRSNQRHQQADQPRDPERRDDRHDTEQDTPKLPGPVGWLELPRDKHQISHRRLGQDLRAVLRDVRRQPIPQHCSVFITTNRPNKTQPGAIPTDAAHLSRRVHNPRVIVLQQVSNAPVLEGQREPFKIVKEVRASVIKHNKRPLEPPTRQPHRIGRDRQIRPVIPVRQRTQSTPPSWTAA